MTQTVSNLSLSDFKNMCTERLEDQFKVSLRDVPALELKHAMEYALLNGGKRLRPLLIYAAGAIFNAPIEALDLPACAVELIHTYSLIHDDLPCMDNADLRRGKASCHKAYGDGMAVLAGDALHTLAMQLLCSQAAPLKPERRVQMMIALSKACGPFGMAAGQALDITVMHDPGISIDLLTDIYELKTGALFTACMELGRLASKDDDEINQRALHKFGQAIGLAFQIQDDILDVEAEAKQLGKDPGMDVSNNKVTYPKIVGLLAAKEKVQTLYQESLEAINYLGSRARILRELVGVMLERKH